MWPFGEGKGCPVLVGDVPDESNGGVPPQKDCAEERDTRKFRVPRFLRPHVNFLVKCGFVIVCVLFSLFVAFFSMSLLEKVFYCPVRWELSNVGIVIGAGIATRIALSVFFGQFCYSPHPFLLIAVPLDAIILGAFVAASFQVYGVWYLQHLRYDSFFCASFFLSGLSCVTIFWLAVIPLIPLAAVRAKPFVRGCFSRTYSVFVKEVKSRLITEDPLIPTQEI